MSSEATSKTDPSIIIFLSLDCDALPQNLYAKRVEGLQRALNVQRLIHNWVRSHWGLGKQMTPAMAMGYCGRPLSTHELLTLQGFQAITP